MMLSNHMAASAFRKICIDPHLIRRILEHLGLWVQKSSRDPSSQEAFDQNGQIVYEPYGKFDWSYWLNWLIE